MNEYQPEIGVDQNGPAADGVIPHTIEARPLPLTTRTERGRRRGPYEIEYEIAWGYDDPEADDEP